MAATRSARRAGAAFTQKILEREATVVDVEALPVPDGLEPGGDEQALDLGAGRRDQADRFVP